MNFSWYEHNIFLHESNLIKDICFIFPLSCTLCFQIYLWRYTEYPGIWSEPHNNANYLPVRLLLLLVSDTFIHHFLFRYMVLSSDSKIKVSEGSPDNMPDDKSYEAAVQIQNLISKLKEKDILIVLISGTWLPVTYYC